MRPLKESVIYLVYTTVSMIHVSFFILKFLVKNRRLGFRNKGFLEEYKAALTPGSYGLFNVYYIFYYMV